MRMSYKSSIVSSLLMLHCFIKRHVRECNILNTSIQKQYKLMNELIMLMLANRQNTENERTNDRLNK